LTTPDTVAARPEVVRLEHVTVRYGDRTVLEEIAFAIPRGEFVGLIGPNGAGKTTLLRAILGLVAPTAGRVLINGQPARRGSRRIGYVPQAFTADADLPLRARDLVALGLDGDRWGVSLPSRARRERVDRMLEHVGASAYADAPVGRLSGGERQRLLIAQAMITEPDLLLLDEPLSNLDIRSSREVVELVRHVATEHGAGVLLVAHDLNALLGAMDRVLYVARGRAAIGTVDQVVRTDVLSRLYGYHVDVLHVHGRILVVGGDEREPVGPHEDEPHEVSAAPLHGS